MLAEDEAKDIGPEDGFWTPERLAKLRAIDARSFFTSEQAKAHFAQKSLGRTPGDRL